METVTATTPRITGTLHIKKKASGPAQTPAAKPVSKPAATSAPRPAARPAPKRELVSFRRGREFTVVFSLPRRFVPEGIQVVSESGGGGQGKQEASEDIRFGNAKLDLAGLLSRCVVGPINVRENSKGYCRVYVNCTAGVKPEEVDKAGLYHWMGGAYEPFVRKQLALIYSRVIVRTVGEKMFLEMRKVLDVRDADAIVRFAVED